MRQLAVWRDAVAMYRAMVGSVDAYAFHIGASSGTPFMYDGGAVRGGDFDGGAAGVASGAASGAAESNLLRIGIGVYGIDVTTNRMLGTHDGAMGEHRGVRGVRPVLSLWAKIVGLKRLQAGDCVGYGFTFQAAAPMTVVVLPLGYYEALPRRLSNIGCVRIRGHVCPIVGRVSMNLTVVDVTPIADQLALEDDVEVLSADSTQPNSVENVARACDMVPYEILVKLAAGIKRVFV